MMEARDSSSNTELMYLIASRGANKTMMDWNGFVLPGGGDPYNTCGKFRFVFCGKDLCGKRLLNSCKRLSCPVCCKKAGSSIADKVSTRIWSYGNMINKLSKGRRSPKSSHIVESISPDSIFWSYGKQKQLKLLSKIRKDVGIQGGVEILHPWRFEEKKNKSICIGSYPFSMFWMVKKKCIINY